MRCSKTLSNVILLTFHYPDLGSASNWSCCEENSLQPIRCTAQKWVVTRHQYGISALVSQTSLSGETSGSVAKCRLFSQAMYGSTVYLMLLNVFVVNKTVCRVVIDWGICSEKITEVKVPITNFLSHPNIHIKQWCSPKKFVDSNETRFFSYDFLSLRDLLSPSWKIYRGNGPFYSHVLNGFVFAWKQGWRWTCLFTNLPAFHAHIVS